MRDRRPHDRVPKRKHAAPNPTKRKRKVGPSRTSTARNRVQDKAPCTECGLQLWEHPRCILCERFMWCTAQLRTPVGELIHSHGCLVGVD